MLRVQSGRSVTSCQSNEYAVHGAPSGGGADSSAGRRGRVSLLGVYRRAGVPGGTPELAAANRRRSADHAAPRRPVTTLGHRRPLCAPVQAGMTSTCTTLRWSRPCACGSSRFSQPVAARRPSRLRRPPSRLRPRHQLGRRLHRRRVREMRAHRETRGPLFCLCRVVLGRRRGW